MSLDDICDLLGKEASVYRTSADQLSTGNTVLVD